MAFSQYASAGGGAFNPSATPFGQAQEGRELQEIQTDELGFKALRGESKLKILPSWPADSLPPPTSSLLSVASNKGLIAAGGPDGLVITSTESVRQAFSDKEGFVANIKAFEPEVKIQLPKLSQIAFSADESVLVVSAQHGGGLAAYQTDGLTKSQTSPAVQIPTNSATLRALIPNPHSDFAELFAVVTSEGDLLIADFKAGKLRVGLNGEVLKDRVSCLSWSKKGKQLVAGLADGTATQMKPDGSLVASIPRSPALEGERHISAISWLENDTFLAIYTPTSGAVDGIIPQSNYYIISREKGTSNFTFQKLPEICAPFGLERTPSFHFITRLRNFPPHLQDLILVASTTSPDVGLVTKSDAPLDPEQPVVGAYTTTNIQDDTRRPQLPLSPDLVDTSPIGFALDLSSKEGMVSPIPSEPEIPETETPVPNLLLLNNEGILVSWWVVYAGSVREKTAYPGLVNPGDSQFQQQKSSPQPSKSEAQGTALQSPAQPPLLGQSGFGQSAFVTPTASSAFAKPAASTFGAPTPTSAFDGGSNNTISLPSAPLSFGGAKPSWASTGFGDAATPKPAATIFRQSSFGSATPIGAGAAPAFGAASSLGNRTAPFGRSTPSSTLAFGQPAGFGILTSNAFGSSSSPSSFGATSNDAKPPGFASFAKSDGFSGVNHGGAAGQSSFAKPAGNSIFGKDAEAGSFESKENSFGGKDTFGSSFATTQPLPTEGLFGASDGGFNLETSFKRDRTTKDDLPKPDDAAGFSMGGLGNMLEETDKEVAPIHDKEEDMGEEDTGEVENEVVEAKPEAAPLPSDPQPVGPSQEKPLITPPSTISQSKATPAPALTSLFGTSTQPDTTPAAVQNSMPTWSFGTIPSTTPKDTPKPRPSLFTDTPEENEETPKIKTEPPEGDDAQDLHTIPEAPLPPNPTSKTTYTPGDTSTSSIESNETPLPSDNLPTNRDGNDDANQAEPPDGAADDFSSDFEGSGEDVSHSITPIEEPSAEHAEQIHTSPESSFGRGSGKSTEASPTGGLFTKVTPSEPSQKNSRPLFGEVTGPVFPPPKPQESPRSPSPVRHLLPIDLVRPEHARSVSAPTRPESVIDKRKGEAKSTLGSIITTMDSMRRDEERVAAAAKAKAQAEADRVESEGEEAQQLQDDEDERLRAELMRPVSPSEYLDAFIPYQQSGLDDGTKSGIPGQIEILYQDINSMIDTLGINLRSLSAFLLYQTKQESDKSWPGVLSSDTPEDALNEEWFLEDISRFHEGQIILDQLLERSRIADVRQKVQKCQELLITDLVQLRSKLTSTRKNIHSHTDVQNSAAASLTAEQLSIQHDLRKASTSVQSKLAEAEQKLTLLLARVAEMAPQDQGLNGTSKGSLQRTASQKKPTVEAVTSTINKMTAMAEKKTVDIDILETQLKKLGIHPGTPSGSRQVSVGPEGKLHTPYTGKQKVAGSMLGRTPASNAGSVYHTPDSRFSGSIRLTPSTGRRSMRSSLNGDGILVSAEDAERWRQKARRKMEIEAALIKTFAERRSRSKVGKAS